MSVELVGEHAVHINLALHRSDRKLFLHPATTAGYDSTLVITMYFNPHGFLATLRTREESRQVFFGNMNDFSSSPSHPSESFYVLECSAFKYFMFVFGSVGTKRPESLRP
jgi:hypothetical protein